MISVFYLILIHLYIDDHELKYNLQPDIYLSFQFLYGIRNDNLAA